MTFKPLIFENFQGSEVVRSSLYQKNVGAKFTIRCVNRSLWSTTTLATLLSVAPGPKLWLLSLSRLFNNKISCFSLTIWQMAQCVGGAFFNFNDLMKDTFVLSKMIVSVGGVALFLNPSSFGTIVSSLIYSLI